METERQRPSRRRNRALVLGILAVVAFGAWGILEPDGVRGSEDQEGLPLRVYVDGYGLMVGMDVTFADERDLVSGRFSDGIRASEDAFFLSNDRDDDVEPEPFPVDVGRPVSVEDSLFPDCGRDPSNQVTLTVQSQLASGNEVTNTFSADPSPEYAAAVRTWCESGVHGSVTRSSIRPDGTTRVLLRIANPGPGAVTVEVPRLRVGGVDWAAASRQVEGGTAAVLEVNGCGIHCGAPTPWTDGGLTADGTPVQFDPRQTWC